ncbi:MAG TPA: phage tail protein [Bacilli bacterium]|nr:phage tail protein [Bacilli bacterium]
MSEPYLGEIRLFSFEFPPRGWAICNGAILRIQQNQALYALLGTTYGGDGVTTFALPDLRGRVPVHFQQNLPVGARGGEEKYTLSVAEMPQHTHQVFASSENATLRTTKGNTWALSGKLPYALTVTEMMHVGALAQAGGSQAHENMQPYLTLNYCIALMGIFPPRD